jgi:hypothetical protein
VLVKTRETCRIFRADYNPIDFRSGGNFHRLKFVRRNQLVAVFRKIDAVAFRVVSPPFGEGSTGRAFGDLDLRRDRLNLCFASSTSSI